MTLGCAAKQSKGAFIPGCFFFIISFCDVKADKNPQISPEIPNVLLTSYTWQMFDKVKQNMKHMLCTDGMFGPL